MRLPTVAFLLMASLTPQLGFGATVSGTVTDTSGTPIRGARIDHFGKTVVVAPDDPAIGPSSGEVRTNAEGSFQITTTSPAFVIRKPGYQSERVRVYGDARVQITLQLIKPPVCKIDRLPKVKTKEANDVDYTATWFYVEIKGEPRGIISGKGPMYSWGAPSDDRVWTSAEYFEVMDLSGFVDARGRAADGTYWRTRGIFDAAAQYNKVDQVTAEVLDCVMDRVVARRLR